MPRRVLLTLLVTTLAASESYCPWWPALERWGVHPKQIEFTDSFRQKGIQFTVDSKYRMLTELSGRDISGKPWTLQLGPVGMTTQELYAGDFDRNGREDYLITAQTGSVGMAPSSWTQFVMIDSNGRPVPWLRRGYSDPRNILFSDFNKNGHLEWTDTRYGASNRDHHHYWTSTLYEARDAHWHPLPPAQFTQFTNEPNRRPFRLTEAEKPPVADLGSAPTWETPVTLTDWQQGKPRTAMLNYPNKGLADFYFEQAWRESAKLTFSNGETCFLGLDAETILDATRTISWIDPTKQALSSHPLLVTVTRHRDHCRIERIVIHAQ